MFQNRCLPEIKLTLSVLSGILLLLSPSHAAPNETIALPSPGFEKPENTTGPVLPEGWTAYQWGASESKFESAVEAKAGRNGGQALRATNIDPQAKAGIYTHANLKPGTYEMSAWVRAEKGKKARASIYLASAYSRMFRVGDEWTQIKFTNNIAAPMEKAEINIQNATMLSGTVWFDDVVIREIVGTKYEIVDDTRQERPRTLMFSPMNVNYLRETAADWAKRGFRGFLFDGVMASSESDVWSVDRDPNTRGEDDKLLQEVRESNRACKKVGIDSNFVKSAFYEEWPDPFDDAAWATITTNYAEGARFARLSECAGMAIDVEYKAHQFQPTWEGYAKNGHSVLELKRKIHQRFYDITRAMLKEYPTMVLLTLPEGIHYYGELVGDLYRGTLQALAEAKAPGGLHVMTEGTYDLTDVGGLDAYVVALKAEIDEELTPDLMPYWNSHCTIALGGWPLGYYRQLLSPEGKDLGWGGKKEVFGDKVIGSYADKSDRFSPEAFASQMAGLNTFSPRYNWIYAHGATFWQWTPEEMAKYPHKIHNVVSNSDLPTVGNLDAYFASIAKPRLVIKK